MLFQPLEQFELRTFFSLPIPTGSYLWFLITNHTIYLVFVGLIFFLIYVPFYSFSDVRVLPQSIYSLFTRWNYLFIYDLLSQQVKHGFKEFLPLYFYTFNIILFMNFLGLTPFGFTITSHLLSTMTLSFIFIVGLTVVGFKIHGLGFLNLFIPKNIPKAMVPFLVVFEIISYVSRVFSLAIRLFANMMAGHALLYILSSFTAKFQFRGVLFVSKICSVFPLILTFLIFGLEIGIAALQAYVFIVLLAIYLNDVINPAH